MELKLTYVLQQHNKFQVYILSALKRLAHKHLEFFFSECMVWMNTDTPVTETVNGNKDPLLVLIVFPWAVDLGVDTQEHI